MTLDSRYPAYAGTGSAGMTMRRNDKKSLAKIHIGVLKKA